MADERRSLTSDLASLKEELSRFSADVALLRERLQAVEKEKTRLARCLDEASGLLRTKAEETERLKEEATALRVKHAQEESRTEAEIRSLRREIDALKLERQTELGELKESNHEALATKVKHLIFIGMKRGNSGRDVLISLQSQELKEARSKLQDSERQLGRAQRDLELQKETSVELQERLRAQERALHAASETLTVKNSALMRLEAKVAQLSRQHSAHLQERQNFEASAAARSHTSSPVRSVSVVPPPTEEEPSMTSLIRRAGARLEARGVQRSADWSETMGEVSELESDSEVTEPTSAVGQQTAGDTASIAARELEATEAKLAALQSRLQQVQRVAERGGEFAMEF